MPRGWIIGVAVVAAMLAGPTSAQERESPMQPSVAWEDIRGDIVGDAAIADGAGVVALDAPFRAQDAAAVPVRITQPEGAPRLRRLTLVVDENPAPVAADFTFGPAMGPVDLETRIRVDAYSNVRVIAEAEDGTLYMIGRYVRAAGGCSAPASKDAAEALADLGKMRARWFDGDALAQDRREAQVMLRHPNYSGLQRNQLTQLFVPARFVDTFEVRRGETLVFAMEGGISISENPLFRFRYTDAEGAPLSVRASDTDGSAFTQTFAPGI